MNSFVAARDSVLSFLREELVGPGSSGKPLCTKTPVVFPSWEAAAGPWLEEESGQEILTRDTPCARYGVGVLYPRGTNMAIGADSQEDHEYPEGIIEAQERAGQEVGNEAGRDTETLDVTSREWDSYDDLDLSTANAYRPSSLGLSFIVDDSCGGELQLQLTGARYEPVQVTIAGTNKKWWIRRPISLLFAVQIEEMAGSRGSVIPNPRDQEHLLSLQLEVQVHYRRYSSIRGIIVTACALNREAGAGTNDARCLFQAALRVQGLTPGGQNLIVPYLQPNQAPAGEEDESLDLLYRD